MKTLINQMMGIINVVMVEHYWTLFFAAVFITIMAIVTMRLERQTIEEEGEEALIMSKGIFSEKYTKVGLAIIWVCLLILPICYSVLKVLERM